MINRKKILKAQQEWAAAIVKIGSLKNDRDKSIEFTSNFLDKAYGFDLGKVLFKPTKTAKFQFRCDKISAMSYFIGGNDDFAEDKGFALTPWQKVEFADDLHVILEDNHALVMGNYYFTDMDNNKVKVEYSFGYILHNGSLKINLHHSSLPFAG